MTVWLIGAALAPAQPALAEAALQRAEAARFRAVVAVCGDAGRAALLKGLTAEQRTLENLYFARFGHSTGTVVLDDRGDCEKLTDFRHQATDFAVALDEARDALGGEK